MGKHRAQIMRPMEFHWSRKLVAIVSAFLLVATALGGGVMFAINSLGKNIKILDTSDLNYKNRPSAIEETDESPINILVMGSDSREGDGNTGYGQAEGERSDTTLLVHIYRGRESALIVSIPRDSLVTIPDCIDQSGVVQPSTTQKFNAAFSIGGPDCTVKTVESLTNLRIDKFVVFDFSAFKKVVDAIGGVNICLVNPISDPIVAGHGGSGLNLPAGDVTLNGDQALQFVRARKNLGDGSDVSRITRQQAFMGAIIRDMSDKGILSNPGMIFQILQALTESLATNQEWASVNTLQAFGLSLADLKPKNVTMTTTPYQIIENGNIAWTDDAALIWESISKDEKWPLEQPEPAPTTAVVDTPVLLPSPSDVSVLVLNGTNKSGLARSAADVLSNIGFVVSDFTSTDLRPLATQIRYLPGSELKAQALKQAIGFGSLTPDATIGSDINLVIGKDWVMPTASPAVTVVETPTPDPSPSPSASLNSVNASNSDCLDLS